MIKLFTPDQKANPKDITAHIKSVAFSRDGSYLVIGAGKSITIWDVASGIQKNKLPEQPGSIISLSISVDDAFIASSASQDRSISIWDFQSGKKRVSISTNDIAASICFNPKNYGLAVGEGSGQLSYLSLDTFLLKYARELSIEQLMLYLIIKGRGLTKNQNLPNHLKKRLKASRMKCCKIFGGNEKLYD